MPIHSALVDPLIETNLDDKPCRTPGWYFDEHTSQFIFSYGVFIFSFVVEDAHSELQLPDSRLKKLANVRASGLDLDARVVGCTCAAAATTDGEVWLTRYALSGSSESPRTICKGRPSSLDSPIPQSDLLMDEESGRIVLHGLPELPLAVVIDFALVRKP